MKYIELIHNKKYDNALMNYIDEKGQEYYVFSPVRVSYTFSDYVDVVLNIPEEYLYISEFYPFYLLEAGNKIQHFNKYSEVKDELEDSVFYNYYIKKSDFKPEFIVSLKNGQDNNDYIH